MKSQETNRIEALKPTLDRVRALDRRLQVTGAYVHLYESHPAADSALAHLERKLHIRLPDDYRQFLLQVGYGAGPGWGLWSPDKLLVELEDCTEHLGSVLREDGARSDLPAELRDAVASYRKAHPGPPLPGQPFPFTRAQAEEYNSRVPKESNRAWLSGFYPADGCIPIADDGRVYFVLVVTGDAAGTMWEVAGDDLPWSWRPARRPWGVTQVWMHARNPLPALSATPTFLDWYGSWVEQCLVDLLDDRDGYLNLALAYQDIGAYAAAVDNWNKAMRANPGNPLAYYYRGLAWQALQRVDEASADLDACLSRDPDPLTRIRAQEQLSRLHAL